MASGNGSGQHQSKGLVYKESNISNPAMSKPRQKTVLVTGCSDGSAGAALAREFHSRGLRVLATSTDGRRMRSLDALGITTLALDCTSPASRARLAEELRRITGHDDDGSGGLDMLVNNAAAFSLMPLADVDLDEARGVFDVNVFGPLAMVQTCLPFLLAAADSASSANGGGDGAAGSSQPAVTVVNVGSISAVMCPPWQGVYAASKAALLALGNVLRVELAPLGIGVVTVMSGGVATAAMQTWSGRGRVPEGSLYRQLAPYIEGNEAGKAIQSTVPSEYARQVVDDLLGTRPRPLIWRGAFAWVAWAFTWLGWVGMMDGGHIKRALLHRVHPPRTQTLQN
ncbi:hypothetical protein JDV02_009869 [Purpureocillium takamizusanense]|uniref:Ketoreductase domain-containing protein n=1 Tax=Purpureocillium takamizusanense TaxID=2060973 RepID=A0A9Q8VFZ0_9HYPO|nr:uncharacterized protein JDV02_009869 [Purpureocillium takamizusanense]UNI24093.1 hypothetical protein JDV02_009869 [Purpureocillium takamizusanense]